VEGLRDCEHGDSVDFITKACGLPKADAARQLIAWPVQAHLPCPNSDRPATGNGYAFLPACRGKPDSSQCAFVAELQTKIRRGSICEMETLARLRGLPVFAGLQLAMNAGQLWFVEASDGRERVTAWLLTDSARRVAQARRLDGLPWNGIGAKAKTLVAASGDAAWPVGAASIGSKPFVALVEAARIFWPHGTSHSGAAGQTRLRSLPCSGLGSEFTLTHCHSSPAKGFGHSRTMTADRR